LTIRITSFFENSINDNFGAWHQSCHKCKLLCQAPPVFTTCLFKKTTILFYCFGEGVNDIINSYCFFEIRLFLYYNNNLNKFK